MSNLINALKEALPGSFSDDPSLTGMYERANRGAPKAIYDALDRYMVYGVHQGKDIILKKRLVTIKDRHGSERTFMRMSVREFESKEKIASFVILTTPVVGIPRGWKEIFTFRVHGADGKFATAQCLSLIKDNAYGELLDKLILKSLEHTASELKGESGLTIEIIEALEGYM